ncbi:hypothetical protein ES703_21505 [subsurface metagenome]
MSSGKLDKNFQELMDNSFEKVFEQNIDFSKIVIPFSKIIGSLKLIDIYSGKEKIPFKERNPDYKMILKQEFVKNTTI